MFDGEGRLVGITAYSKAGGQNLNFALPADWVEILRGAAPAEAPIRELLLASLTNGDARESPAVFREAAWSIVQLRKNPAERASIFGRIARAEARAGNKDVKLAKEIAEWASPEFPQDGDFVNFQAAWCFARVGNFRQAAVTAELIKGSEFQWAARVVISAEQALSGDIAAAREYYGDIAAVPKQADAQILSLLAWAFAEMGQVKEALDCVEKIRQLQDFVGGIRATSAVAGALVRHGCEVGATALFQFVHGELMEDEESPEFLGRGARVLSLGFVAWEEAACGHPEQAWKSVETAMKIVKEGGIDHEGYRMKIEALAWIAEVSAKIGKVDAAKRAIKRIPVLSGDLAVALAYIAIALDPIALDRGRNG